MTWLFSSSHINNSTHHEYFPNSLEIICDKLDLHYEAHSSRQTVPLKNIEASLKNIQQWSPLIKPILTVEMSKYIQKNDTKALLWLNALCSAIDCPVPKLDL